MYIKIIRGSGAYWNSTLNELLAMIRCLGPPHYFLTLSCNDLHRRDMVEELLRADDDTTNESLIKRQKLVEKYTLVVSFNFVSVCL